MILCAAINQRWMRNLPRYSAPNYVGGMMMSAVDTDDEGMTGEFFDEDEPP
jgi:hypothetical protein